MAESNQIRSEDRDNLNLKVPILLTQERFNHSSSPKGDIDDGHQRKSLVHFEA